MKDSMFLAVAFALTLGTVLAQGAPEAAVGPTPGMVAAAQANPAWKWLIIEQHLYATRSNGATGEKTQWEAVIGGAKEAAR
jgi:hypothetical protein